MTTSVTETGSTTYVPASSLVSMTNEQSAYLQLLTELQAVADDQGNASAVQKFLNDLNSAINTYGTTNADGSLNDIGQLTQNYGSTITGLFESMFVLNSFSNSKDESDDATWLSQYQNTGLGTISGISSFISEMLDGTDLTVPSDGIVAGGVISTGDSALTVFWDETTDAEGNRVWPSGQTSDDSSVTYTFNTNGTLKSTSGSDTGLTYSWSDYSSLITILIMNGVNMSALTGGAATLTTTTSQDGPFKETTATGYTITESGSPLSSTNPYTSSITIDGTTYSNLLSAVNDQYFATYTGLTGNNMSVAYMLLMSMYDNAYSNEESGLSNTENLLTEATNDLVTPLIQLLQSMTSDTKVSDTQAEEFANQMALLQDLGQTTPAFSSLTSSMDSSISNLDDISITLTLPSGSTDTTTLGAILSAVYNDPTGTTLNGQTVTTSSSGMMDVLATALTQLAQTDVTGTSSGSSSSTSDGISQEMVNTVESIATLFTQQSQQVSTDLSVETNYDTQAIALGNSVADSTGSYQQMIQTIINNGVVQ